MSMQVQQMFAGIAGRYDAANEVLSFGVHRLWRAEAVRQSGAGCPVVLGARAREDGAPAFGGDEGAHQGQRGLHPAHVCRGRPEAPRLDVPR